MTKDMAKYRIMINHIIRQRFEESIPEAIEAKEPVGKIYDRLYLSELSESQMRSVANLIGESNLWKLEEIGNETFGSFVKKRRTSLLMTQRELADAMGITLQSVSMHESGKGRPSLSTVRKYASALKVDAGRLAELAFGGGR